eukprot:TRINITY_DN793_c0_g1_i1.p1 TRINITY_DN793_c0_g1~~TRINITY_DN793_c0_g1_i1.p1  ORF type:complete len:182 (-),score=27.04 TRINITY_DN793_c0_g1_i1:86-631(-)
MSNSSKIIISGVEGVNNSFLKSKRKRKRKLTEESFVYIDEIEDEEDSSMNEIDEYMNQKIINNKFRVKMQRSFFKPFLYIQRLCFVANKINELKIKSVLDVGCGQGKLVKHIKAKNLEVRKYCGLELRKFNLQQAVLYSNPLLTDYIHPRKNELKLQFYCGSILETDYRVKNIEAVVAVEV